MFSFTKSLIRRAFRISNPSRLSRKSTIAMLTTVVT
jgi:hypothetical protein